MICKRCGERGPHIQPESHDAECVARHPGRAPEGVDWRAIGIRLYREFFDMTEAYGDADITPLSYFMQKHRLPERAGGES